MSETRKLAAILVADVVGYSRLAGADEERTLARLRGLRSDLIDPAIAAHHGRVVKRTGDGSIIEFRSVVDAVRCAIEVQTGLIERYASLPPEKRIEFRVGVHLGDVVEESDGDLMGDGVNIAARLEGIAKPGAICLSEDAYRQVKQRLDLKVSDLGPTRLRNIAESIRVYSLDVGQLTRSAPPASNAPAAPPQWRPSRATAAMALASLALAVAGFGWQVLYAGRQQSTDASAPAPHLSIVVLPFANLSGDASQDYLGDVLTEELTTSLSRLPDTFVVSRTTAFAYRGKAEDVKAIGRELGVRYALEGSAQKSGGRIRVTAQLIDSETGAHLWADQFDANQGDMLEMQDEIVTRLAHALQIQLTAVEASRVSRTHPENSDAEELAMQCEAGYLRWGVMPSMAQPAYALCERTLEMDGRNVRALAILAIRSQVRVINLISDDPKAELRKADEYSARALALDPNNYLTHYARAFFLSYGRPDEAIEEAERALALNPSFLATYIALATANLSAGHAAKTVEYVENALRLSPRDPLAYAFLETKGRGLFSLSRYDEAAEAFRQSVAVNPELPDGYAMLSASLAMMGHHADAREMLQRYLALPVGAVKSIAQYKTRQPYDSPFLRDLYDRVDQGLRKAGIPEG
jgi:adenylate cyclase